MLRFGNCLFFILFFLGFFGCHSVKWNNLNSTDKKSLPPNQIKSIFDSYENGVMVLDASCPGNDYLYDVGEKDMLYGKDSFELKFSSVELRLHEYMPLGKILVDFSFVDGNDNRVEIPNVDLLRLTPKLDAVGEMIYPELLLEEFNRFGYNFRKEHNEFKFDLNGGASPTLKARAASAHRTSITNNCLAATKWEFAVISQDYSDFEKRLNSVINTNQNKILAHSWFYINKDLYNELLRIKNPFVDIDFNIEYDTLSDISEKVFIDFNSLRNPVKCKVKSKLIEVGHQSNRQIVPVDVEEYYKDQFGLLLADRTFTYKTILDSVVQTVQFKDEGFYTELTPKKFDFGWMKHMDQVDISIIDIPGTDAYVEINLTGEWSPYKITIGNVDLAQITEQKLFGMLFGINTYPKGRRYNPVQNTLAYDPDLLPKEIRPYVLLTDNKMGTWVNNQYKGVEKIYLTYDSVEKSVLSIYVLCYERITPVWMAKVKLPNTLREKVRIRNSLYNY